MTTYSTTYIGIIVAILAQLAQYLKLNIGTPEITTTVYTLISLIGGLIGLYGRFKAGGISIFGVKNTPV